MNIIKFFTASNLWIALASFCFYQVSLVQLGNGINITNTSIFIFFSALFSYNLLKFFGFEKKEKETNFITKIIVVVSASACFFYYKDISAVSIKYFIVAGLLTFLYANPLFVNKKRGFSIRKFWFLKSITVALVWTITSSIIPLIEFQATESQLYLFSLEKFLFILGITIPYDIKDLQKDKLQKGMTSFVMKFGVSITIIVSNFVLFCALCLAFYLFPNFRLATILIYTSAIIINVFTNESRTTHWYTFLVDGLIILYLFIYLFISKV